jgi:hypothetical protein
MTYCARYRFKLISPLQIETGTPLGVRLPGLPPVTVEMGDEAYPVGHWAIATIGGFATEKEARTAGQRLGDTLLVAGAVTRLGVDVGFSRSTLQFSAAVHAAVKDQGGKELRAETHGLMVYQEGSVAIVGMQARGSALISLPAFEERLAIWIDAASALTERQRNCAALLNDSFFVTQTEGRFILLISAVEALCDQTVRDARYQYAIEHLKQQLEVQTSDDEIRETLRRTLSNAKRQSLRQAYMAKFRALLSQAQAKEFDELYQKRSKLVHDGIGRGELTEATNTALELATDLLKAELRQTASST